MKNIKTILFIFMLLLILAIPVYAKTKRPYATVQSGYVNAYVIAGEDVLYPVELEGFIGDPVLTCSPTNQLAHVACQSLSNTNGSIWIRSLEFTGELRIGWIAYEP